MLYNHLLTSDAQAEALAQKRASIIATVVISLLTLIILLSILYLINFSIIGGKTSGLISYQGDGSQTDSVQEKEVDTELQQAPPKVQVSVSPMIAAALMDDIALPESAPQISDLSLELTESNELNELTWGEDATNELAASSASKGWVDLPKSQAARCSAKARYQRLKKYGGSKQCEHAVVRALEWLQSTQNADGSWGEYKEVGYTGLALLCFLGHCETTDSVKFGTTVSKAINYLLSVAVENEGKMASDFQQRDWPYEHAIATYALAETYTLSKQHQAELPELATILTQAANYIVNHQHSFSGGWDYHYATESERSGDSSLTCWHLQALKACKLTRISDMPALGRPARKGLEFLRSCQRKSGGVHYYPSHFKPTQPDYGTMTGAAILCYQQWGKSDHTLIKQAMSYAKKDMGFRYHTPNADLYKHYYYAQAFINMGGAPWRSYNKEFRNSLLANQNSDGSWQAPGGGKKIEGTHTKAYASGSTTAKHYRTCLAVLMLEVYYRYLPTQ